MNKAVVALALVILAGCGQKGPLYIPQPEKPTPETSTKAPAVEKTTVETKKDADNQATGH